MAYSIDNFLHKYSFFMRVISVKCTQLKYLVLWVLVYFLNASPNSAFQNGIMLVILWIHTPYAVLDCTVKLYLNKFICYISFSTISFSTIWLRVRDSEFRVLEISLLHYI